MKTKLLRKLREKHHIVCCTVDVIRTLYSVTPLNHYRGNNPGDAEWCTFGYDRAKEKQRELILQSLHE
jgi:hypothetical protein